MLERDDHCTYTNESALTRRMWYKHSDTNRSRHAQSVMGPEYIYIYMDLSLYIYIYMELYILYIAKDKIVRLRNSMLCIYCCGSHYDLCSSIPSLPFLKLHGVCCHFSFVNIRPKQGFVFIYPTATARPCFSKLNGLKSPVHHQR